MLGFNVFLSVSLVWIMCMLDGCSLCVQRGMLCGKAGLEFMDVSLCCSGVYVYTYRTASGERPASW